MRLKMLSTHSVVLLSDLFLSSPLLSFVQHLFACLRSRKRLPHLRKPLFERAHPSIFDRFIGFRSGPMLHYLTELSIFACTHAHHTTALSLMSRSTA